MVVDTAAVLAGTVVVDHVVVVGTVVVLEIVVVVVVVVLGVAVVYSEVGLWAGNSGYSAYFSGIINHSVLL